MGYLGGDKMRYVLFFFVVCKFYLGVENGYYFFNCYELFILMLFINIFNVGSYLLCIKEFS